MSDTKNFSPLRADLYEAVTIRLAAGFRRLSKFLVNQTEQRPDSYPEEYPSVVRLLSSGTYRGAVVKRTPLADEIHKTSDYLELLKSQLRNN